MSSLARRLRHPPTPPPSGAVPWGSRLLLASEIAAAYVRLAPLVRSNDLETMVRRARTGGRAAPPPEVRASALRLGRIVDRVLTALPTDNRCLIRSLVVLRLLDRRGIEGRLVIGVQTETSFGAHAWVEHEGRPVLPSAGFNRLVEL